MRIYCLIFLLQTKSVIYTFIFILEAKPNYEIWFDDVDEQLLDIEDRPGNYLTWKQAIFFFIDIVSPIQIFAF